MGSILCFSRCRYAGGLTRFSNAFKICPSNCMASYNTKKTTELRRWGFFCCLGSNSAFFQIIQLTCLSGSYLQQHFYIYRHRAIIDYIKISSDLWKPHIFHLLFYICAAYFTFERRTKEALLCFYRHLWHILSQKHDSVFADWKQGTLDMNAMNRMQTMNQRMCLRNPEKVSIT